MTPDPGQALRLTWTYCASRDWTGMDPYDGLMARRFPATLLKRSRLGRLVLIQGMKHSPINFRKPLGVPELRNPKAVALGLDTACRLTALDEWRDGAYDEAARLGESLLASTTPTPNGHGWGYPFDWQSRAFFLKHGVPTVVCTGFVVRALDALLDLLDADSPLAAKISKAMRQASEFVLHDLRRSEDEHGFCFSYSPLDRTQVVNATLLGAEIVARVAAVDRDPRLFDQALPTVRWTLARWRDEGGWLYGGASSQQWEDSFHTGFNLLSYLAIRGAATRLGRDPDEVVEPELLDRAYGHYARTFFEEDGRPWYYSHKPWPIDAHCAAVAVLTHLAFANRDPEAVDRARRTLEWTLENMWVDRGWFSFQIRRWYRSDIPYIRWTQAWMLRALAEWAVAAGERPGERAGGDALPEAPRDKGSPMQDGD